MRYYETDGGALVRRRSRKDFPERLVAGKWVVWDDLFAFDHETWAVDEETARSMARAKGGSIDDGLEGPPAA